MIAWLAMIVAMVASPTIDRPRGRQTKERIAVHRRLAKEKRDLPGIIEQQRRQHDDVPGGADRIPADVAHIGIHSFATSHCQKHPPEDGNPAPAVPCQ